MKKSLFQSITLFVFWSLCLVSCQDEFVHDNDEQKNFEKEIAAYLEALKSSAEDESDRIDELVEAIDFNSVRYYEQQNTNEHYLVASVEPLSKAPSNTVIKAIFFVQDGQIVRSNLVAFSDRSLDHRQMVVRFFNGTLTRSEYSGKMFFLSPFQDIIFFNWVEDGNLKARGSISRREKSRSEGFGKTETCIDWYLVTTYYHTDGSKTTTEEYIFTTCDEDCNTTRLGVRTSCGGSGGPYTPGGGGPTFPNSPQNGDRFVHRYPNGKEEHYLYLTEGNFWTITLIVLPEALVTPQTYPYLLTDSPQDGLMVEGPGDYIWVFDAWGAEWGGGPMAEVGDPDPHAIPIEDPAEFVECFNRAQPALIKIYVTQPVHNNNAAYHRDNVGHAFLGIHQDNIIRTLGFYPAGKTSPLAPEDPSVFKSNAGKHWDVLVSIQISAVELNVLLNYITVETPALYNLNTFNCTNWIVEAFGHLNIALPVNQCSWPGGGGLCPGQFGQDLRNFDLPDRAVSVSTATETGNAPVNTGFCQ